MKKWTENKLNELPVENGFRLRSFRMTRLETITDAAFAFASDFYWKNSWGFK